jgi:hypothetical protein
MTSANSAELTATSVIERIESGQYPRDVVLTIARGFLPLPQDDNISVLAYLTVGEDTEIKALASASLKDVPSRSVIGLASNENAPERFLTLLTRATEDHAVLEALIRNRTVPDSAILELATHSDPVVQEVIVINQARILRAPEILDALLANPRLSADARRRALETREEFFEKKARAAQELPEDVIAEDLPEFPIDDLLEKAAEEDVQGAPPVLVELTPMEKADPEKVSVFTKILRMSVSEKVKLAFKGGKTERMILIRERNRLVCSAVMRNPRMNDQEVEGIAGMRNVDDEVLRLITMNRGWMSKYNIVIALARNPKAPVGVVLPLINRLTLKDLKNLKDDKGVSEAARTHARKLFVQRTQKSG